MYKRYFRKRDPNCPVNKTEWIEMTDMDFYQFINSPEGKSRYFIIWDDLVIEASKEQYDDWLREAEHRKYLRQFENGYSTISLYSDLTKEDKEKEEQVSDPTVDVEYSAMENIRQNALLAALRHLDYQSFYLIYSLYLARHTKTEHELAKEVGISQQAVHKRKRKILSDLKFLVVKLEKNPQ